MVFVELLRESLWTWQLWLSVLLVLLVVWYRSKPSYNLPPRPHGWPLVGNMLSIPKNYALYRWCKDVAKDYGPVFRLTMGTSDAIVLNDIAITRKALVDKSMDFAGRPHFVGLEVFSDGYNDIAFVDADQPTFSARRKLFSVSLRNFSVGRSYEQGVRKAFAKVSTIFDDKSSSGHSFNPADLCKLLTYNHMAGMCFNKSYDLDDSEFVRLVKLFQDTDDLFADGLLLVDMLPILRYIPIKTAREKKLRKIGDEVWEMMYGWVDDKKKQFNPAEEPEDLTTYILKVMEETKDDEGMKDITDIHIKQLITDVFSAGVDTSQMTLRWLLLILATHQHVQEKIYQEILDVIGKDADGTEVSSIDHRAKMPYSEASLLECTRFGTVAPLGLMHKTLCDTKIDDFDIPKGTLVFINLWAINNDEREFTEPDKFVPERFLTEAGQLGPRPRSYLPFGLGRRSCPGETSARTTLWSVMIMLCRRYRILPPEGTVLEAKYDGRNVFDGSPIQYEIRLERR